MLNKNIMLYKTLILAISVAACSSCSTAYKSTQTPDDVYYSPTRPLLDETKEDNRDEVVNNYTSEDREIMMGIRDQRWRYMDDPCACNWGYNNSFYNYSPYGYYNSPYNYSFNNRNNYYGYYYNPYYYPHPIYNLTVTTFRPAINTTPRMVNLNAYRGYNRNNIPTKSNTNLNWNNKTRSYNNSNTQSSRQSSRVGDVIRKVLTPASSRGNSNDTRTYTPSKSSDNNNSRSSSSENTGGSKSGSIPRPGRGS